jgi:nucleotide-binding universal stress UspA family protein
MSEHTGPFTSVLVPYDGSDPAKTALSLALALASAGATLTILNVVDETPVMNASASSVMAYDPTPLFEALDVQGRTLLAEATARCANATIRPKTALVHDRPVAGILAAAEEHACDLIVMGTHARGALEQAFVGSTTVGILQASHVPVLTTRAGTPSDAPFATLLVAIDDSDASDAAVALAGTLARTLGSRLIATNVADTSRLYANAGTYGFDPGPLEAQLSGESAAVVSAALQHANIAVGAVDVALVEGPPARAILDAARDRHATAVVMGSHGRRGIRHLLLGSVAEHVVREATLPVLVVRRP